MSEINLRLVGEQMTHGQLELLIRIAATQNAIFEILKNEVAKPGNDYDALRQSSIDLLSRLTLSPDNFLELLVDNLAGLNITNKLLVETLAIDKQHADQLTEQNNKLRSESATRVHEDLFERRGSVDDIIEILNDPNG